MINTNLIVVMDILKNANGVLYQKDLIKIMNKDINERQIRRYLNKLKELEFLKVVKKDYKYNILYLTTKAYKEIFSMEKRISNTYNNYILEKNFMIAYMKYKYKNLFKEDMFPELYEKADLYTSNTNKVVLKKYRDKVVMNNMYIYNHSEILEEEYVTIFQILIYKNTVDIKDLKNLIVVLNELIERFEDIENNIMIDYKIYSFNNINIKLLEKLLDKHYSIKENINDIVNKYKIESFNLVEDDI